MMVSKYILAKKTLFIVGLILLKLGHAYSQCAMCKMPGESSLNEGSTVVFGLNAAILLLFFTPFAILGSVAAAWFWHNRKH
jgi:hypothetical protein